MMLMVLTLLSATVALVLSLFMSKNANNSAQLTAYEDYEQMLALSGKGPPQSQTAKDRVSS